MKRWIIIASLLFGVLNLATAQKEIDTQFGSWWMYFGNHKVSEKLSIHTEYQFRRADFTANWQQSLARVGLDYHFNKQNALTAGYGWIISFPYGTQPIAVNTTEHRIWQQFVTKSNSGRFYFNHRYRLEQRFIENASLNMADDKVVDGFKFRQRARYRFLLSIPISKPKLEDNTLFVGFYEEVFLGFGSGIGKNILNQNRLFGALGYRFNARTNVQLGYLNQFVVKSDGVRMERNHMLQLSWTHNLDFTSK